MFGKNVITKICGAMSVGIAMFALSAPANAIVITYDSIVTGNIPASPSPYLTATILDDGAGGVNITLAPSVGAPEFVTSVYFSLNDTTFTIGDITSDPDLDVDTCSGSAPAGTGPWQLCVAFDPSDHARFPDSVTFNVAGLAESAFVFNSDGWKSVAHVQGIEPNCSGWVGAYIGEGGIAPSNSGACGGGTSVPEPGSLGLLGLGLAGLAAGLRRRRKV